MFFRKRFTTIEEKVNACSNAVVAINKRLKLIMKEQETILIGKMKLLERSQQFKHNDIIKRLAHLEEACKDHIRDFDDMCDKQEAKAARDIDTPIAKIPVEQLVMQCDD